jgi:transposase-like protein
MEDYPKTIMEFEARYNSEESCRDYLYQMRWQNGFQCPRCGHKKSWPVSSTFYQCANCDHKVSVISGTIFHGTHKPLVLWFRAIWWLTGQKNGASALGLMRILGLGSYKTAWAWLHKLRRTMVTPGQNKLSENIEVDETYIGGKKPGKRGRGAEEKALVIIFVETKSSAIGRIRLQLVPDASAESINCAIEKAANRGSVIKTDAWPGYNQLNSLGFIHKVVRQDYEIGENLLPSCHRIASLLKRWLLGTHQGAVSHKHLEYYLDEFTFRFNRRKSKHRGKLFYRLLQNAVQVEPIPFNHIVKNIREQRNKNYNI